MYLPLYPGEGGRAEADKKVWAEVASKHPLETKMYISNARGTDIGNAARREYEEGKTRRKHIRRPLDQPWELGHPADDGESFHKGRAQGRCRPRDFHF